MHHTRALRLRKETLAELTPEQLHGVIAGNGEEGTRGGVCKTVAGFTVLALAATAVVSAIKCSEEQPPA